MRLTQTEVIFQLSALGIPTYNWQLADDVFETVHEDYLPEVWSAWIDSLRKNAPQCLMTLDLGGDKSRTVPRWRKNAGDCENHSLLCFAHAQMGNWINVCGGGAEVGRLVGLTFFSAIPRAENRHRQGGHAVMWAITHDGVFRPFEAGDGEYQPWLPAEYQTARFGLAA